MKKQLLTAVALLLSLCAGAQSYEHTAWCTNTTSMAVGLIDVGGPCGSTAGPSMVIADWTAGGDPHIWRVYFKTDLSFIDTNAIIDSASLMLTANAYCPSGYTGSPTYGTDNAVGVYRITGAWDTTTLTWGTQPTYTHADSALLPQSTSPVENYVVDVKNLVQSVVNAHTNKGFLFKHIQETTHYNSMIFYGPNGGGLEPPHMPAIYVKWHLPWPEAVGAVSGKNVKMLVYPNPANAGEVTVDMTGIDKGGYNFTICDVMGRVVDAYMTLMPDKVVIETAKLARGMYILTVKDVSGGSAVQKLVVE